MTSEFVDAICSGDDKKALEALRLKLAEAMDEAPAREKAAIARQIREVLKAIAELPDDKEVSKLDAIRAKASRRKSGASDTPRP